MTNTDRRKFLGLSVSAGVGLCVAGGCGTVSRAVAMEEKQLRVVTLEGAAASINSVANFITALKRSGYFQKIEIKESKQDEKNTTVQTFLFTINAEIAPNGPEATPQAKPATSQGATTAAPAKKG